MDKHLAPAGNPVPGKNLFGGRGVWTIIVAVTLAFTLLTAITSCQERENARQADAERQLVANTTTAVQECKRLFLVSPPDNYELGSSEVEETSSFVFSVVLHYTYVPENSVAKRASLAWCHLEDRGWMGWRLVGSRGL